MVIAIFQSLLCELSSQGLLVLLELTFNLKSCANLALVKLSACEQQEAIPLDVVVASRADCTGFRIWADCFRSLPLSCFWSALSF